MRLFGINAAGKKVGGVMYVCVLLTEVFQISVMSHHHLPPSSSCFLLV